MLNGQKQELNETVDHNKYLEQFVNRHKTLVESFRNFKSNDLGIKKAVNVLAPLGADPDPILETKTAILCENFVKKAVGTLDETSRADLPKWVKTGLAMISASHAEDITDKVISEQPMQQRAGKLHYLDIQTETTKGSLPGSQRIFDALRGYYGGENFSSEKIIKEPIGAPGSATYTKVLEYFPVIPGSVRIYAAAQQVEDDSNGGLVGDVTGAANTINYVTGEVTFTLGAVATDFVYVDYAYNIEASVGLPRYGIALRGITVEARPRAIAAEWSQQAVFDLQAEWGIDAEPTILDAGAKIIYQEKFKHVVNHLFTVATGGTLIFNNVTPAGISYREHIDSFGILVSRLMHEIWQNTQRVRPNVVVFSPDIWFLFQYTKGFTAEGSPAQTDSLAGPKVVGTLVNHNLTCICDPTFPPGSAVLTFRGNEIFNTAAMLGMYIPLYKAPIHVQGFRKDTALLTEYAMHVINDEMLGKIEVINL